MTNKPNKYNVLQTVCGHSFSDFIDTLKGERQLKPQPNQFSRTETGFEFGPVPVGNPNENPNFNQVVPVFVQGNALKAFRYRLFHVLYQNVVIVMALIRQLDRCLTPPIKPGRGVFVFVPPN